MRRRAAGSPLAARTMASIRSAVRRRVGAFTPMAPADGVELFAVSLVQRGTVEVSSGQDVWCLLVQGPDRTIRGGG